MKSNLHLGNSDDIIPLMEINLKIQRGIKERFKYIRSLGVQRIESLLLYYSSNCEWLITNVAEGISINMFYIPIYLRNKAFDSTQAQCYGRLIFYFTHNGKIRYEIRNPSTISEGDIHGPFKEGELVFDEQSSDNHEQVDILKAFIESMNDWEINGVDGRELPVELS
ncbi:MAG: hypothetical protein IPM92_02940 [Saprospiraceae bacterium]|nr:hypothetical protein [Saprospiraceae bacterium]